MTRVNFHLTDPQIIALRELSRNTGLSVAELIRRAVDSAIASRFTRTGIESGPGKISREGTDK